MVPYAGEDEAPTRLRIKKVLCPSSPGFVLRAAARSRVQVADRDSFRETYNTPISLTISYLSLVTFLKQT